MNPTPALHADTKKTHAAGVVSEFRNIPVSPERA